MHTRKRSKLTPKAKQQAKFRGKLQKQGKKKIKISTMNQVKKVFQGALVSVTDRPNKMKIKN